MRLSVVIVNWNGGDAVVGNVGALASLARHRGDSEILVVDNGSADGSCARLQALADATLRVVTRPRNIGFGPACNVGAAAARGDLVLFLNPDVRPHAGEDPLGVLIEAADSDPAHAGFCPLLDDDADHPGAGDAQRRFQFRRVYTPGAVLRDALLVNQVFPNNRALARDRYLGEDRRQPFEVEQPAAAALLIRRAAFEEVGGFDPRFVPAWWEDVDLAVRLKRAGHRLVTVPGARFVHRGGASLQGTRRVTPYEFGRIYTRNLLCFASAWWGAATAVGLRVSLAAGNVLRLLLLAVGVRGDRSRADAAGIAAGALASACRPVGAPVFPRAGRGEGG